MKITLKNVRLAFPSLFEPQQVNGEGAPAFSASFLFEPGSEAHKTLSAAIKAVATDKWGAKGDAILAALVAGDKTCLHDGNAKTQYVGFEGMRFVSARSKTRPNAVDRDRSPLDSTDGKPYAGCYVNAVLDIWPQDNKFGKRVNAGLMGVQFVRDGDAFSGGVPASVDDFEDLSPEGSAIAAGGANDDLL